MEEWSGFSSLSTASARSHGVFGVWFFSGGLIGSRPANGGRRFFLLLFFFALIRRRSMMNILISLVKKRVRLRVTFHA